MSRNMSTLESLSIQQEDFLYDELKEKLSVDKNQEIQIWPERFLKSMNIVKDLTENELKVLDIDYGKIIKKIALYHPHLLFYGDVEDTRYDFAPGKKQIRETLRIRRKKDYYTLRERYLLTIKQKNISDTIKKRSEFEVPLAQHDKFDEMFRSVSLLPLKIKEKVRSSFKIEHAKKVGDSFEVEDIILDLDAYYESIHIPPLLEIEGNDEKHIMKWIRKLGLEEHEIVNWSSRQMLKHYHQWPGVQKTATSELASSLQGGKNPNGKHQNGQGNGSKKK